MPVTQTAISVGTSLVQVVAPDSMAQRVTLHNLETVASRQIWIGGSTLVQGQSVHINSAVILQLTVEPGDALFAVTTSGTYSLGVIVQKQD
jgi:hypothetical protein